MVNYAALALKSKMNPDVKSRLKDRLRQNQIAKELLWKQARTSKVDADRQHKIVEVVAQNIPGFFPTPQPLAYAMVGDACIDHGMRCADLSAGTGNIAREIRAMGVEPVCVEINRSLWEILVKEFPDAICGNSLEDDWRHQEGMELFDRIVVNPPFENHQDAEHIQHAFELLAPRGILVAIASEHSWFASHKADREFIHWFNMLGGQSEKLPAGTFLSSQRPTGVNTRLITLQRLGE